MNILEWLQQLPEPYRGQAIENYKHLLRKGEIETEPDNLHEALCSAFVFNDSKEGGRYWFDYCETIEME